MPEYIPMVNTKYPKGNFEHRSPTTSEEIARQQIEAELTILYGDTWERGSGDQYWGKVYSSFNMAWIEVRYSVEEKERAELERLPGEIAKMQRRLAELQAKYPQEVAE